MPEQFELVKWYLDTVEADGAAAIAYWAALSWHGVHITWHNLTRYAHGQAPDERSSVRSVPAPVQSEQGVTWQSPRLGVATVHDATSTGTAITLLDDPRGTIVWECLVPAAHARFEREGASWQGTGYVERMRMSIPPWELPIDQLRWGRWISDDAARSVVWIDWRGSLPRQWVVVDGMATAEGVVEDNRIAVHAGLLSLDPPRTLHERSIGRFLRRLSDLARVAARIPISWQETKWCARGTWTDATGHVSAGWAIHETAKFT